MNYVNRMGAQIKIQHFDAPKEFHHEVIAPPWTGMNLLFTFVFREGIVVPMLDTGRSYKTIISDSLLSTRSTKSSHKKQPDYRKFEKKKRF